MGSRLLAGFSRTYLNLYYHAYLVKVIKCRITQILFIGWTLRCYYFNLAVTAEQQTSILTDGWNVIVYEGKEPIPQLKTNNNLLKEFRINNPNLLQIYLTIFYVHLCIQSFILFTNIKLVFRKLTFVLNKTHENIAQSRKDYVLAWEEELP